MKIKNDIYWPAYVVLCIMTVVVLASVVGAYLSKQPVPAGAYDALKIIGGLLGGLTVVPHGATSATPTSGDGSNE